MGGNEKNLEPLFNMIMMKKHELMIISDGPLHTHYWRKETWLQNLSQADVVICVANHKEQPCKSNNRLTQAMSLGKPVICSPLPAYKEIIQDGVNGFICDGIEAWEDCLTQLENPELRAKMGEAARETALRFSIESIGQTWLKELTERVDKDKPQVDIIIPSWNNLTYLQETIKSIRANTDWPHIITVINSGTQSIQWLTHQPDIKVLQNQERLHFSEAVNKGIKATNSPYIAILNDDLIVAENWLNQLMFEAQKPGIASVNPFSNCDLTWRHNERINVGGIDLVPAMRIEQVQKIIPQIYKLNHKKEVKEVEWNAMFCTVIPRKVIDEVGLLDEAFKSGCEDYQWSKRAARHKHLLTFDSVVFHFGGVSRERSERLNPEQHHKEDYQNNLLMRETPALVLPAECPNKGSQPSPKPVKTLQALVNPCPLKIGGGQKMNICFYTGPAWDTWNLDTPNNIGIGGSETVVGNLAKEFAKLGHKVQLYGQHRSQIQYGVNLHPYEHFQPATPYDLLIISRNLDIITDQIMAKKVYAVAHDIWFQSNLKADPKMNTVQLKKIDKYIALSPWHKQFLASHHQNIPQEKLEVIPNYFDVTRYHEDINKPIEKVPDRLIYASSLDRGLLVLLHCYPWIKQQIPELSLRILYGVDGWEKTIKSRGTEQDKSHYERVMKLMKDLKPQGVEYVGKVNQIQLAEEFKAASLWAHPTFFSETFCLTALEAFASKTPVITTNLAALTTTVGEGGILLNGDPTSTEYCQSFVQNVINVLKDKNLSDALVGKGLQQLKKFNNVETIRKWLAQDHTTNGTTLEQS